MSQIIRRYSQRIATDDEVKFLKGASEATLAAKIHQWLYEHDPEICEFLQTFPDAFLVGGAVRNILSPWEESGPKDYDISIVGHVAEAQDRRIADMLCWLTMPERTGHQTLPYPKCIEVRRALPTEKVGVHTLLTPVQLLFSEHPDSIIAALRTFDFTLCQMGFGYSSSGIPNFWVPGCEPLQDVADQVLCYTNPQRDCWAGTSLTRAYKFSRMGYRITTRSMAELTAEAYRQTCEQANRPEWQPFEFLFPDLPGPTPAADDKAGSENLAYHNFVPRFLRGLAYYNKGGSIG